MATIGIDARLWNQTGIGRYIRNLVAELLEVDTKNQYVLFARPDDIVDIKAVSNKAHTINPIIIPTSIRWHSVKEQLEFPRLLNKYNLDLMHFPYFSVPIFYKKPFVVTVHDLIINHFPTGRASTLPSPLYKLKRAGYGFVLKRAIHDAKKVIVPSLATKNEIVSFYKHDVKKDNIVVTPEGLDGSINDFEPALYKPKNPYFLYVGNAYPHKNLEKLIEAFKMFTLQVPGYSLFLVGREDYFYKRLKEHVRREKIDNVEFLGYVSDTELSKLYAQARATIVPSLMEGFGLTALEAMSMGSLVAVSKIPSLSEVCGKNVLYFDPEDVLSIVTSLQEIANMSDAERKKMVGNAKKHAESFSFKKTAQLTLDAYSSSL